MKSKIISIFAAIAISLGGAAIATSANASTGASPAVFTGGQASDGIQLAHFRGWRHRHGRGWRHRRMCRRLYILAFRYGNWRARRAYYRHCVRRSYRRMNYGYGPGYGGY